VLGTRDYQPSRPARHIHWKASARLARLQEKVFEPSGQGRVLLALELGGFQAGEAFEGTLEVIASAAVRLAGQGFAVGFLCNAAAGAVGRTRVPPGRGPGQLPMILESLALLQPVAEGSLEQALRRSSLLRGNLACVVFRLGPGDDAAGRLCRSCGVPVRSYACQPAANPADPMSVRPIDELRVLPRPLGAAG